MTSHEDREPARDDVLHGALRDAVGEPPFDDVDTDALRGRIRERAAPELARRRADGPTGVGVDRRVDDRSDRRRVLRRWLTAVPLAAAAAAAFLLFTADEDGADAPATDAGDAAAIVTAEDALLADVPEDELRRRVTGRADPAAWLSMAVADDEL